MVVRMLIRSPRRPWHRHLDKSSLVAGVVMVLFGLFVYHTGRESERMHRVHYYKRAAVTPTQDYLAAFGFTALGLATAIVAIVHGRADSDRSQHT
jgi:NADH:ubiquinone oxidoreductase subunit 6 (subunit J)